jgi:hypothetical protein
MNEGLGDSDIFHDFSVLRSSNSTSLSKDRLSMVMMSGMHLVPFPYFSDKVLVQYVTACEVYVQKLFYVFSLNQVFRNINRHYNIPGFTYIEPRMLLK